MKVEPKLRDRNLSGSPKRRGEVEQMGHVKHHTSIPCGELLIDMFRKKMQKLSESGGFRGLRHCLSLIDNNSGSELSSAELAEGCQNFGVNVSADEIEKLLKYLNKEYDGYMSAFEFIKTVRPIPTMRRQNIILKAYSMLDHYVSNSVPLSEIMRLYDASSTPDVVARKRTVEEVLDDFKNGFENEFITRDEFSQYYADIGASIDDDDYFELMMRNGWHISGGEGNCRNTSCMRVLVTFLDTRQQIVEIKNDLRIDRSDTATIKGKLLAQGVECFVDFEVL